MVITYTRRIVDSELDILLPELAAILIDGAKGVGKTKTALERARTVRQLDNIGQAEIARADPLLMLDGPPPVLLDEWQRAPEIWDAVKRAVDLDRSGGRFILTGFPTYSTTKVHSGAGRIASLRMRPMTLPERGVGSATVSLRELLESPDVLIDSGIASQMGLADYVDEILATGFPGIRTLDPRARRMQLAGYVDHIVERDVEEAGLRIFRPAGLRRWLQAYASATSSVTTFEKIRLAAVGRGEESLSRKSTIPYFEALTALRILDPLEAWDPRASHLHRIGRMHKHHLVDPGLAAQLLGLGREALLSGRPGGEPGGQHDSFLGALFESLATLSIRVFAQAAEATVSHLRTSDGRHEVDLIVSGPNGRLVAVEVKMGTVVRDGDVKHLKWLKENLGQRISARVVINTGEHAYRRSDGIVVLPLALLGP